MCYLVLFVGDPLLLGQDGLQHGVVEGALNAKGSLILNRKQVLKLQNNPKQLIFDILSLFLYVFVTFLMNFVVFHFSTFF